MNLGEALSKRTELQHAVAVYEELICHLNQFLESDIGSPESVLEVDDCLDREVSQEVIDVVQQTLVKLKQTVEGQLDEVNKLKVETAPPAKKRSKRSKA